MLETHFSISRVGTESIYIDYIEMWKSRMEILTPGLSPLILVAHHPAFLGRLTAVETAKWKSKGLYHLMHFFKMDN